MQHHWNINDPKTVNQLFKTSVKHEGPQCCGGQYIHIQRNMNDPEIVKPLKHKAIILKSAEVNNPKDVTASISKNMNDNDKVQARMAPKEYSPAHKHKQRNMNDPEIAKANIQQISRTRMTLKLRKQKYATSREHK